MTDPIRAYCDREFGAFPELFRLQAQARPDHPAIVCGEEAISYCGLDALADRVAAALQRDGVAPRGVAAICASSSIPYAAIFAGTLRAGAAAAPLSPSSTPDQLAAMAEDCGASHLFLDAGTAAHLAPVRDRIAARIVLMEELEAWLAPEGARPDAVEIAPGQPFNIIYSSGTTGTPKGIVQSHRMRWPHLLPAADPPGFGPDAATLISTPLYSNTTLVAFFPTLAGGGTVVLMAKFDPRGFLELSQRHRVTHAMLVPVQYRRILELPDFDAFDLSSYRLKFATSAPFPAELKREVLRRWPGGLVEYYGMTEGGGTCILLAHSHPDKLHTVGRPAPGHDMKVIDAEGNLLPPGRVGEVVGRSGSIMTGYHNRPAESAAAEWIGPDRARYIRTGDLASVDEDGFFTLVGRAKDMIISGGINIYPADLEAVLVEHPTIAEAAVVGVPSERWGETPVAFVTLAGGTEAEAEALRDWANRRLGRMQRIAEVRVIDELPRNAIGKVLKRALRDRFPAGGA